MSKASKRGNDSAASHGLRWMYSKCYICRVPETLRSMHATRALGKPHLSPHQIGTTIITEQTKASGLDFARALSSEASSDKVVEIREWPRDCNNGR